MELGSATLAPPALGGGDRSTSPVEAFYKLDFGDFCYYLQTPSVTVGRRPYVREDAQATAPPPTDSNSASAAVDTSLAAAQASITASTSPPKGPSKVASSSKAKAPSSAASKSGATTSSSLRSPAAADGLASASTLTSPSKALTSGPSSPTGSDDPNRGVDVDLGAIKSVSRRHARISYDTAQSSYVLEVLGRNGAWVDDVFYKRGDTTPLNDRSKIQISIRAFHFILPPPPSPSAAHTQISPYLPAVTFTGEEGKKDADVPGIALGPSKTTKSKSKPKAKTTKKAAPPPPPPPLPGSADAAAPLLEDYSSNGRRRKQTTKYGVQANALAAVALDSFEPPPPRGAGKGALTIPPRRASDPSPLSPSLQPHLSPLPSSVADRPTAGSPSPSPSRIKIVSPSAQSSYSTRIPAADQSSPPRPEHSSPPPPGVPRYGSGKGGAVMAQYRANMPPPRPLSPSPPPSPSQLPSSPPAPFPSLSLAPPLPPPPPQFAPPADDTLPSDISRLSDVDLDDDASVASSSRLTRGAGKGPAAQAPARDVKVESSDEEGHESMEMPDGAMTFVPPRKGPVNPRAEKRPRRPSATSRPKIEAEPAPSLAPAVQPVSKQEPAPVAPAAFAAPPVLKSASPPPAFSLPPQPPVPPANPIASSSTAPVYHQSLPAPVPIPSTYAPKPFVPSIPLPAAHPLSDNPLSVLLPPKGQLNEEGYPMKPPLTYTTLILLSLQAFVEHKATIPEMCEWIMGEFDWYRVNKESGWQNSLRHNLATSKAFIKLHDDKHVKAIQWTFDASLEQSLNEKAAKEIKSRLQKQEKMKRQRERDMLIANGIDPASLAPPPPAPSTSTAKKASGSKKTEKPPQATSGSFVPVAAPPLSPQPSTAPKAAPSLAAGVAAAFKSSTGTIKAAPLKAKAAPKGKAALPPRPPPPVAAPPLASSFSRPGTPLSRSASPAFRPQPSATGSTSTTTSSKPSGTAATVSSTARPAFSRASSTSSNPSGKPSALASMLLACTNALAAPPPSSSSSLASSSTPGTTLSAVPPADARGLLAKLVKNPNAPKEYLAMGPHVAALQGYLRQVGSKANMENAALVLRTGTAPGFAYIPMMAGGSGGAGAKAKGGSGGGAAATAAGAGSGTKRKAEDAPFKKPTVAGPGGVGGADKKAKKA